MRNQPKGNQTLGSNGLKHSRFARPDQQRNNAAGAHSPGAPRNQAPDNALGSNWLCTHYKRRCYVKFQCCDRFWPCHRCHNNQSNCGQKQLESRDTQMVKCVYCNKEQQLTLVLPELLRFRSVPSVSHISHIMFVYESLSAVFNKKVLR